ncbi:MAG: hypothetical protein ACRDB9_06480, partial [Cetobacterium sp.]
DKKKLLYLDPTDNTWKKPTLDGKWENGKFIWGDEVLKHSDGKYYYHERTERVAYVAGDESKTDRITDMATTVKKLAQEKVCECTNIDLITYPGETNYAIKSGVLTPRTTLKVHNNISNVLKVVMENLSVLRNDFDEYRIKQDRLQLNSTYSADRATFKIDTVVMNTKSTVDLDQDLFILMKDVVKVGKHNYNRLEFETMLDFYVEIGKIDYDMWDIIWIMMELQHNPPVEEVPEI